MENASEELRIRRYFRISIFAKGTISFMEIVAGLVVLFIPTTLITSWVISLAQNELIDEPNNFLATHTLALAQYFAVTGGTVIAMYLLSRGIIKFGLVFALLKNQLWAYPASLVVLGGFILYQLYDLVTGFSSFVLFITLLDLVVIYFIWQEYLIVRKHSFK